MANHKRDEAIDILCKIRGDKDLNDPSVDHSLEVQKTKSIDPEEAAAKRAKMEAAQRGEAEPATAAPAQTSQPPQTITQALTQSVYEEAAGLQAAAAGLVSSVWPGSAAAHPAATPAATTTEQGSWLSTLNPANLLGGADKPQEVKAQA